MIGSGGRRLDAGINHIGFARMGAALVGLVLAAGLAQPARADTGAALTAATASSDDLTRLSLEELANVEITSVSKAPESISEATAAVFVITADDIRRSGATSLPEVLRLAPNLEVARIDAMSYAITARGFNSRETSNKLLVMVDGRSIYTPLYSGVSWDTHDVPLGEIERIEVISGPGGALYGANAVNGVINIITRNAHDGIGVRGGVALGTDDARVTARIGTEFEGGGAVRAYLTAFGRDSVFAQTGAELGDDASGVQGGFRADWGGGANAFTFQGDLYHHNAFSRDVTPMDLDGGNLLGRWTRTYADGAALTVQAYYDRNQRQEVGLFSDETTYDLTVQHNFAAWGRQTLTVGAGYRLVDSNYDIDPVSPAFLLPAHRQVGLSNAFFHDRINLTDKVNLVLALKAEDSTLSGLEWLPSVRLGWAVNDQTLLWARVERAVRTPSRIDRDLTLPGFLEAGSFEDETLWAYEVGYRGQPTSTTTLTVAAYFNDYDDLRTVDLNAVTFLPVHFGNSARGQVYGIEAWGSWDVTDRWRLNAGISALHKDFQEKPGSLDITAIASRGDDPAWQAQLRSQWDITDRLQFDVAARAVDKLDLSGVPGYVAVDARLGWELTDEIDISIAGYNLFDDRHIESFDAGRQREIGRSAIVRVRWRP